MHIIHRATDFYIGIIVRVRGAYNIQGRIIFEVLRYIYIYIYIYIRYIYISIYIYIIADK